MMLHTLNTTGSEKRRQREKKSLNYNSQLRLDTSNFFRADLHSHSSHLGALQSILMFFHRHWSFGSERGIRQRLLLHTYHRSRHGIKNFCGNFVSQAIWSELIWYFLKCYITGCCISTFRPSTPYFLLQTS